MLRRHELTDAEWDAIEAMLPGRRGDPGRTAADDRLFVNAVLFVARTGVPWRDLPGRFGKWNSVWRRDLPAGSLAGHAGAIRADRCGRRLRQPSGSSG